MSFTPSKVQSKTLAKCVPCLSMIQGVNKSLTEQEPFFDLLSTLCIFKAPTSQASLHACKRVFLERNPLRPSTLAKPTTSSATTAGFAATEDQQNRSMQVRGRPLRSGRSFVCMNSDGASSLPRPIMVCGAHHLDLCHVLDLDIPSTKTTHQTNSSMHLLTLLISCACVYLRKVVRVLEVGSAI